MESELELMEFGGRMEFVGSVVVEWKRGEEKEVSEKESIESDL